MAKMPRTVLAIFFVGMLIVTSLPQQSAIAQSVDDETLIRQALNRYFDLKYEARATATPKAFGQLVASSARARRFLQDETDRRELEYFGASLFHLKYDSYTYTLDVKSIEFSEDKSSATIVLLEGNEVTFENLAPIVSRMGGLNHTISFVKENNNWVLAEDSYEDDLVRFLKINHLSKTQAKQIIVQNYDLDQKQKAQYAATSNVGQISPMLGHSYNGAGAANWASTNYVNGFLSYNNYLGDGSDCANFVSWAMHSDSGGGVPLAGAYPDMNGAWWSSDSVRGYASWVWLGANKLILFITSPSGQPNRKSQWPDGGPDGNPVSSAYSLGAGDIIGWSWDGVTDYDHVAIVTGFTAGDRAPLITDRQRGSPEYHYNVPYTFYNFWYFRIFVDVYGY